MGPGALVSAFPTMWERNTPRSNPVERRQGAAQTKERKPRAVQARQRLADWVRGLGVTDSELSPNHAWRHTFKQIADRAGITERMSDYITGHAPRNVGAAYPNAASETRVVRRSSRTIPRDTPRSKRRMGFAIRGSHRGRADRGGKDQGIASALISLSRKVQTSEECDCQ